MTNQDIEYFDTKFRRLDYFYLLRQIRDNSITAARGVRLVLTVQVLMLIFWLLWALR